MKLTSPEIVNLIQECALQKTDTFLRLGEMPRADELEAFAAALGTRVLTLLPGAVCIGGVPGLKENARLLFADVRELLDDAAPETVERSGVRELVLPFYELADVTEYGYKTAYGGVSDLRSFLPYPVHITGISFGDHLNASVFEALGTADYVLVGDERTPEISAVRAANEREAAFLTADQCGKYFMKRVAVICTTRTKAETLHRVLTRRGVKCELFHGGRTAAENAAAAEAFRTGKTNVLAATKSLLPCYPFMKADKLFYFGLPYSLSHARRMTALGGEGKLTCVYCEEDIALHRKLTASFAAALGVKDDTFFETRETQLTQVLGCFAKAGYS